MVGPMITQIALKILTSVQSVDPFNYSDLVLIPKSNNINTPPDFRPIGVCNTFFKIIVKVLADRLGKILPSIISDY